MIMDNPVLSTISAEEYFRIEETSEVKHEYFQGDMYAMAGAGSGHNLIVSNLIRALGNQLRTSPCLVYPSDMRVQLNENSHYTYPDVTIVCDEPVFLNDRKNTLLNPMVIFEVLSESAELYGIRRTGRFPLSEIIFWSRLSPDKSKFSAGMQMDSG